MESHLEAHIALAMLDWQIELGADEAICDAPVDRYALGDMVPARAAAAIPTAGQAVPSTMPPATPAADPVEDARRAAAAAADLPALRAAMEAYAHCDLKRGARQLVFSDGVPGAPVMILGEAPGREEDLEGRPFVGRAGQLLDRMLAAIDLSRRDSVYITNVVPWRPPGNREPTPEEIAMMRPFLERHIELAAPRVLVVMGNVSADAVLRQRGILRLRGRWTEGFGRPVLPMTHPAYLLRNPAAKREAWADLLSLKARLGHG